MRNRTFIKDLKKFAHLFQWRVNTKRQLRATLNGKSFCPITAVYFVKNAKRVNIKDATDVAPELRLSYDGRYEITEGADMVRAYPKTRKRMLEAVGLKT